MKTFHIFDSDGRGAISHPRNINNTSRNFFSKLLAVNKPGSPMLFLWKVRQASFAALCILPVPGSTTSDFATRSSQAGRAVPCTPSYAVVNLPTAPPSDHLRQRPVTTLNLFFSVRKCRFCRFLVDVLSRLALNY